MSWSSFALWVGAKGAGLIRHLPDFILRAHYPVPRIREHVTILVRGAGPQLAVAEGAPARIVALELVMFNRLPFPIEVDGLHVQIGLDSRTLATFDKVKRLTIAGGEVGLLQVEHDLTDSQAQAFRAYPEGQPPSDCALLRISGELNLRTSFRALTTTFNVDVRAFVHRGK